MEKNRAAVEIAVQDSAGVATAINEGATRIELCGALVTGGLTPSYGAIEGAVEQASNSGLTDFVQVLIRPRPGGFVYDREEIATTLRDIRAARQAGASGVVIGALNADRTIDKRALQAFVDEAEGLSVTFHRAIDIVQNVDAELATLIEFGLDRVLTSGQAVASADGIPVLQAMVAQAAGSLQVMAGGGVTIDAIPALISAGVDAVHLSAKSLSATADPSGPGGGESTFDVTNPSIVRAAVEAVADLL